MSRNSVTRASVRDLANNYEAKCTKNKVRRGFLKKILYTHILGPKLRP